MEDPKQDEAGGERLPFFIAAARDEKREETVETAFAKNPLPEATLCDLGVAVELGRAEQRVEGTVVVPVESVAGIDPGTVRLFHADEETRRLRPVWTSGLNAGHGFVWGRVRRPGVYVPIGLPRDRLLREALALVAERRRLEDGDERDSKRALAILRDVLREDEGVDELRALLATLEVKTSLDPIPKEEIVFGQGGHIRGFVLPGGWDPGAFRERIERLEPGPWPLPEEELFNPPELIRDGEPPWQRRPGSRWQPLELDELTRLGISKDLLVKFRFCWFFSQDWWMYHANERHTGVASGCSDITSTTVSRLALQSDVGVDGTVVTIPTIVGGKIYVGTAGYGANAGTLYKIDLATGNVDGRFPTTGNAFYSYDGIGSSPAVVGGRAYFTAVHGKVYCVDTATMTTAPGPPPAVWVVDLKHADAAHNQPVDNPSADSWTSPLVVNNRVYVASGEGEAQGTFSFVYCLDASTGNVLWLFCTNQFVVGTENSPNVIPQSTAGLSPLPAMFSTHANPPHGGSSPWSSCAYDATLDRIYVGTGNSQPDNPLPDERYASGMIALDATTGAFRGFFQPDPTDSYRAGDFDVDVPAAPMIFRRGSERVVCIGSKNGSFFLLHPDTLAVLARRQLLPRDAVTGANINTVDPTGGSGENKWGVLGTAAVHSGSHKLFVGLGGYVGLDDYRVTPFVRALDWDTLDDAWPTTTDSVAGHQVDRYSAARPPLYTTPDEAALSSPAVVNDVVFVSTGRTALYALRVSDGLCLWQAPGMPAVSGWPDFSLGPAIYGDYVVVGAANHVLIYHLRRRRLPPWWYEIPFERYDLPRWPWPPPPPDPWERSPELGEELHFDR